MKLDLNLSVALEESAGVRNSSSTFHIVVVPNMAFLADEPRHFPAG
jgi:hypothetical protein